jgi:succinylglutamate desuccinylase
MGNNNNISKLDQYKETIRNYISWGFNGGKMVESYNQKFVDLVKRLNNSMIEKCKKEYENFHNMQRLRTG